VGATLNLEFVTVGLLASLFNGSDHSRGRLIGIIPAKRIGQVLTEPYIEPTAFEHYKKDWKWPGRFSCPLGLGVV